MQGRYGVDELSLAMGSAGVVLALVGSIFSLRVVSIIALVLLVLDLVRAFSRNMAARRSENDAFLSLAAKIPVIGPRIQAGSGTRAGARPSDDELKRRARTAKKMWSERKTKAFIKCPTCGAMLSVPKGKGKIIVTCPKCRTKRETRS